MGRVRLDLADHAGPYDACPEARGLPSRVEVDIEVGVRPHAGGETRVEAMKVRAGRNSGPPPHTGGTRPTTWTGGPMPMAPGSQVEPPSSSLSDLTRH